MLVDMAFMRMMEVTIVQIVDVAAVADGGVATTRPKWSGWVWAEQVVMS